MNQDRTSTITNAQLKEGYKQTEVGIIPEDWLVTSLGELGNFKNGINKNSEAFGHGHPFVNLMDVFGVSSISAVNLSDLIETNNIERQTYNLKEGDVLFIRSSVKPSGVGLTALVEEDLEQIVYSGFLIRFRDGGTIGKNFKKHCFYEEGFRKRLISASSVSANTNINQDNLKQLLIPLPPTKAEQEAIACTLSDIDALIESLDRLLTKKRQIKQGAMQELLRSKDGWKNTILGNIAEKIVGGGTPSRSVNKYWDGNIPWMTVKDFASHNPFSTSEYITQDGLKNSPSNLIPKGTLITSTRMGLGKAVIFEIDVSINQDLKAIFPNKDIDPLFLYYWFQFNKSNIADMGSGSTVMGISLDELRKLPFAQPSTSEQIEIASILSDMDAEIDSISVKLTKTRQLKQGMMHELLTGRIRLIDHSPSI